MYRPKTDSTNVTTKRKHRLSLRSDKVNYAKITPIVANEEYSWVILVSAFLLQIITPSILASYGSFLLFDQIENVSHDNEFMLWDHEITQVPIAFLAFWTILDPWSQSIVTRANSPRAVLVCGMCLSCCGFLITYAAELHEPSIMLFYILSGAVTGFGASLILQQCDSSIQVFFRGKLKVARNALYLGYLFGYILIPFTLGKMIIRHGALESLLVYQVVFVAGVIIAAFFKAPKLVMPSALAKTYSLLDIQVIAQLNKDASDEVPEALEPLEANEEVTVFNQMTRPSILSDKCELKTFKTTSENEEDKDPVPRATLSVATADVDILKDTVKNKDLAGEVVRVQLDTVREEKSDDKDSETTEPLERDKQVETGSNVTNGFNSNVNNLNQFPKNHIFVDITSADDNCDKIGAKEHQSLECILNRELFGSQSSSDIVYHDLSENIYTIDASTSTHRIEYENISNEKIIDILMIPSFYKYSLLMIASKLSMITFWVLYPSLLYDQISYLNVHHTINNVTFVTIGGLVFTVFWNCFNINKEKSKLCLALSFFLAATGFYVISIASTKNWLMFGGIISTTALASIHALIDTILLQSLDELKQNAFLLLNTVSGFIILMMVTLDIEYIECFQIMSLIQLLTASIWLSSVLFKKIFWLPSRITGGH